MYTDDSPSHSKSPTSFHATNEQYQRILFQCTRLNKSHSYPIDLIVDQSLSHIIASYEHTSFDERNIERREISKQELAGELLEIDAIRCDPQSSPQKIIQQIKAQLESFQIHFHHQSLDYLHNIAWPSQDFQLRCAYSKSHDALSFFSPKSPTFKLVKNQ